MTVQWSTSTGSGFLSTTSEKMKREVRLKSSRCHYSHDKFLGFNLIMVASKSVLICWASHCSQVLVGDRGLNVSRGRNSYGGCALF